MLRGAAKNFAHCAPVCRPDQYGRILEELRASGELSLDTRRRLAAEAFAHTAAYEAAIATWFNAREEFPDSLVVSLDKVLDLAYGENPHQRAAYYAERGVRRHLLSRVEQLHGKELSFNNLNDFSAARSLAREFRLPACVIVKHANPCGVAVATTIEEAYDKALASDPTSAYGGVVVLNREVEVPLGEKLAEQFVEVLFAPGYTEDALDALRRKKNTRILLDGERRAGTPGERSYKRVIGGMLVQDSDAEVEDRDGWQLVTGELSEPQWGDLVFAWRVCKHVASNAIVLVKDLQTIGIGAGQMSRVDAVRIAVEKTAEFGHDPSGSALASDAFFPFPDGPQIALDAGDDSDRPAGRLSPRRGRDRRGRPGRRGHGLHRPPPFPPLERSACRVEAIDLALDVRFGDRPPEIDVPAVQHESDGPEPAQPRRPRIPGAGGRPHNPDGGVDDGVDDEMVLEIASLLQTHESCVALTQGDFRFFAHDTSVPHGATAGIGVRTQPWRIFYGAAWDVDLGFGRSSSLR